MSVIPAIILLFGLKRIHVVYSINNNSLFSAPWVFLAMFFSQWLQGRKKKARKKYLILKKKYQKAHSKIACQLATSWISFHHTTANENIFCSHTLWRVDAFKKTEIETVLVPFYSAATAGWRVSKLTKSQKGCWCKERLKIILPSPCLKEGSARASSSGLCPVRF